MLEDKGFVLKQSHLQIKTDLNSLPEMLDWFEQFTDGLVPNPLAIQCLLVLTECLTVVVCQAHKNLPPTTPIELELKLFNDCLEMRILERGKSFDSLAHLMAPLTETGEMRTPAIRFPIEVIIDEICYIKLPNNQNGLVMRKKWN